MFFPAHLGSNPSSATSTKIFSDLRKDPLQVVDPLQVPTEPDISNVVPV